MQAERASRRNSVFARPKRLTRPIFPVVLKSGRRVSSTNFTAVFSNEASGYAVVVTKKVSKLAVVRNRTKRRIIAALKEIEIPQALIVFPKSSASSVSYEDTKKELKAFLSKAN